MTSAKSGAIVPPADLRFIEKAAPDITGESATAKVVTYLQTLYESVAETMPDFGGQLDSIAEVSLQHGDDEGIDPYAVAAGCYADQTDPAEVIFLTKAKKIRNIKSVKVNSEKTIKQEDRYLPPGACMKDYWDQLTQVHGEMVSFVQFWRAPGSELLIIIDLDHILFRARGSFFGGICFWVLLNFNH